MTSAKLVTVCGSLRSGSVNAAIMRAALANAPDGVELIPFDVRDIPFYDGDVEDAGVPAPVQALNDALTEADGLVIFTPEYNSSYPAVTKNVIDWVSRPPRICTNKGLTLVVASPGGRAGQGVLDHFAESMPHYPGREHAGFGIGRYGEKLTDGELTDADTIDALRSFLATFAEFATSPADEG